MPKQKVVPDGTEPSPPERSQRLLDRGVLVFRWVSLAWMATTALVTQEDLSRPRLALISLGLVVAWTAWLTTRTNRWSPAVLFIDLGVCTYLVVVSSYVVPQGATVSGGPFFATGYPLSAALLWGIARGTAGGLLAGGVLSAALAVGRPLNGVPLAGLDQNEVRDLIGGAINFLVAGGAVGVVSRLLVASGEALEKATEALVQERERAARLAERESLARQIHDNVLQSLAMIRKRGRELADEQRIDPSEVLGLSDLARRQEKDLRALITRAPDQPPDGTELVLEAGGRWLPQVEGKSPLRDALQEIAQDTTEVDVSVGSVGPLWMERAIINELTAAVRQAIANVIRHAQAERAVVYAEREDGVVVVSIRDDGIGFVYDEDDLRAQSKAGILKSMKGRVEDLGGSMSIDTSPGKGTEVEFRIPLEEGT